MVERGIAVNQHVTKRDDRAVLRHSSGEARVHFRELRKRLADDLELTLVRRTDQRARAEAVAIRTVNKLLDQADGFADVPELRARVTPHTQAGGCVRYRRG